MNRLNTRASIALALAGAALAAVIALAGCAPQQADTAAKAGDGASASTTATAISDEPGAFVSDEQCMSCHGGSYEAVAELTADLGDWNPHDSIHGGYNTCVNCHEKDKEVTYNYCTQCHVYAPDEEVLY